MFVHGEELSDQCSAHTRILLSKQINYISDFSGLNFPKEQRRGGKGRFGGFVGNGEVRAQNWACVVLTELEFRVSVV